ncbi:MAG: tyrosine-protein phosphatase [Arenimonas sp.]
MIDLHCHILPGIDDGAPTLDVALAMARAAVNDGIKIVACTPHIYPGLYDNSKTIIAEAIAEFELELKRHDIPLTLTIGADTHLAPDLLQGIQQGRIPTLGHSRFLLLEPPHHVAPPRFEEAVFQLLAAGIVPVITHPERLTWIETHYPKMAALVDAGAWMQITSGSLTGRFGRRPKYWAERMVDERLVHILATDSHHIDKRPPFLAEGRDAAAQRCGEAEAFNMVDVRPRAILADLPQGQIPALPERQPVQNDSPRWRRWLGLA